MCVQERPTFAVSGSLETGPTTWFSRFAFPGQEPVVRRAFRLHARHFLGNPDLKPESSTEFQVGARHSRPLLNLSMVYFKAGLNNEINGFLYDPVSRLHGT
ncbi:MAG: hypothetical protein CM1200mP9_07620 [Gammaproteobacteria bacterium]|nr:MAG: hypothetical protein CM1200mP9_07620 [Gammaproteobacteria bacterium]